MSKQYLYPTKLEFLNWLINKSNSMWIKLSSLIKSEVDSVLFWIVVEWPWVNYDFLISNNLLDKIQQEIVKTTQDCENALNNLWL